MEEFKLNLIDLIEIIDRYKLMYWNCFVLIGIDLILFDNSRYKLKCVSKGDRG